MFHQSKGNPMTELLNRRLLLNRRFELVSELQLLKRDVASMNEFDRPDGSEPIVVDVSDIEQAIATIDRRLAGRGASVL